MIPQSLRSGPIPARLAFAAATVAAALLLLVAAFPVGVLKGPSERALSDRLGRSVTVGRLSRTEIVSFVPTLVLQDVRVGGPAWDRATPVAAIARATVRLPILPLLVGKVHIHALGVAGARLRLVRDANKRTNWAADAHAARGRAADPLAGIGSLHVRDTEVRWIDAPRGMDLVIGVEADGRGVRLGGRGTHWGTRMTLAAAGAPVTGPAASRPWPFAAHIASPLLAIDLAARADRPLDTLRWHGNVRARASDARRLDDVIQAGLPGTQPLAFTARLTRDRVHWIATDVSGSLGRSLVAGDLDVVAPPGGTVRLRARVDAPRFDFDDLATDEDRARGAAQARRTGPRVFPDTRIRLDKLAQLDGTLRFRVAHLLVRGGSMFKALDATATLKDRQLDVSRVQAHLAHGVLTGRAHVDHRAGAPKLMLDLQVHDEQISDFFAGQDRLIGPVQGRVLLAGRGDTFRAALADANGRAGIVSRGGTLQKRLAVFAGGDVLKSISAAIGGGGDARVPVACLIADLRARGGVLSADPLVLDTPVSRLDGAGTISLRDERIDIRLHGRPKIASDLRADPPITVTGTISNPALSVGAGAQQGGGLLRSIGTMLGHLRIGKRAEVDQAPAANCTALAARALR